MGLYFFKNFFPPFSTSISINSTSILTKLHFSKCKKSSSLIIFTVLIFFFLTIPQFEFEYFDVSVKPPKLPSLE